MQTSSNGAMQRLCHAKLQHTHYANGCAVSTSDEQQVVSTADHQLEPLVAQPLRDIAHLWLMTVSPISTSVGALRRDW